MELSAYSQDGTVNLYFIIVPNCAADSCSKHLQYAYQACKDNGLEPVWLSTEECLKKNPTKQDVFVCDPFEGEAFSYLLSGAFKCVRVLGPRCLLTCLHNKKPVPELPPPLHNMAMHELVITSTGFEKEEKTELQQCIERMSGIYSNSFHEGITHLVAKMVGSKKYMVAVEKETPIMTGEWVKAVWKATTQDCEEDLSATHNQFVKYSCPVFKGLVICVSQMPRCEKDNLKTLITENDGTYSATLEMSVTSVLITSSSEGEKYKHALQWRIPCLTQEWIHDSIEAGHVLSMEEYKLIKKKSSTPTHDQSRAPPDVSICSTIMNESIVNRFVNETANIDNDSTLFTRKESAVDEKIAKGLQSFEEIDMQSAMKAGLFLDGCKIYISGFEKALNEKIRRILNAGGATRFNSLTETVSHIVIGKYIHEEFAMMESWTIRPLMVTAGWIAECVKQKHPVDEKEFLYMKETNMSPPMLKKQNRISKVSAPNPSIDETNAETFIDDELINQYIGNNLKENDEMQSYTSNRESLDCSTLPDSQQASDGIFKGKVFTISGYNEEIEEQLVELILVNGGEIAKFTSQKGVDYSLISIDGEGTPHPRTAHYVTHVFIEDCLEQEILVPVEFFHLPFLWPADDILDDCCIATSTYKGKERLFLSHIALKMGALYQDMFAKKDNPKRGIKCSTHLLCPLPEGDKYIAATRWGVPTVTKDWLLKCAFEGQRVPENNYKVDNSTPSDVDGIAILLSLLGRKFELSKESVKNKNIERKKQFNNEHSMPLAPTPLHKNIRAVRNQHIDELANIKTPDAETIRRMYPTPGGPTEPFNLDEMSTPETPYGSTWYQNPSPRIRKAFKRALDSLPDDPKPSKMPFASTGTPEEVYFKKFTSNLKEMLDNHHQSRKNLLNSDLNLEEKENETQKPEYTENISAEVHGPLTGVVVFASRKLIDIQQDLFKAVQLLGGDYRWTYDNKVTHFIHTGRLNDTNREFRLARDQGKFLVSPEWVWMCRDEKRRIDEALFPHTHNPKLSLSIVTTKSTPVQKKRIKSQKFSEEDECKEADSEENDDGKNRSFSETDEDDGKKKESLSKQLEELEAITGAPPVRRASNNSIRNKSLSDKHRTTPTRPLPQSYPKAASNHDTESQNTAITWDDPQEREARAKLEGALVGDTQDIIDQKMQEKNKEVDMDLPVESLEDDDQTVLDISNYNFMLSGMHDEQKQHYCDIIICLGGTLCVNQQSFDPSATHVVTLKPSRSEKHLAAIASGKWILHTSFLDESQQIGKFTEEEKHEWGNERATSLPQFPPDSTEMKLASAAHRWRTKLNKTKAGAFRGMTAVFYSSKERIGAFTRLVEAGQGKVVSCAEDLSEATHCFVELNKDGKVDLASFAMKQIPCLLPVYLNDFLVNFPPPDEMECCIPEYKQIISEMAP